MTVVKKSVGRTDFQRGILSQNNAGEFDVESFTKQQSHRIKQLSHANCFIVLAQDSGNVAAGETVKVQPFPWLHRWIIAKQQPNNWIINNGIAKKLHG